MLEKKPTAASSLKSRVMKKEASQTPSLIEMIRQDSELLDFIKLVHDKGLRKQAFEAIKRRLAGPLH